MQFHQHEIDHPAKEPAFIDRFHNNQRPLFNGFIIQFKVDGADNLTFSQRCGQLRIIQSVAGLQVFQLAFRQRDGTGIARAKLRFTAIAKPDALGNEGGIRLKPSATPSLNQCSISSTISSGVPIRVR